MKAIWFLIICIAFVGCQQVAEKPEKLESTLDKASYSIGVDIGKNFQRQGADVNADALALGLKDALSKSDLKMTDSDMMEAITTFQEESSKKTNSVRKEMSEKNKMEGVKFLSENKNKEGVVELPSGLQYKIITDGKGKSPGPTDTVETHYRGTLLDGTEFDSSYKRGQTAEFPVNRVIAGWTEALQLMKEG